jgi:hypothetical protein
MLTMRRSEKFSGIDSGGNMLRLGGVWSELSPKAETQEYRINAKVT